MSIVYIYLAAAILPAVALLYYVYRQDRIESEPVPLILALVLRGVLAALASIVLETIGFWILDAILPYETLLYVILEAFVVVAASEEGTKLFFLKRRTWNDENFNYRFDAIVYAASVSLGFAGFENIEYVMGYGLRVAPYRAAMAIPGHLCFSIFMGYFYGRARMAANMGDEEGSKAHLRRAFLTATFFHGFYDCCAMIGSTASTVIFMIFLVLMYIYVFRMLKRESATDEPIRTEPVAEEVDEWIRSQLEGEQPEEEHQPRDWDAWARARLEQEAASGGSQEQGGPSDSSPVVSRSSQSTSADGGPVVSRSSQSTSADSSKVRSKDSSATGNGKFDTSNIYNNKDRF